MKCLLQRVLTLFLAVSMGIAMAGCGGQSETEAEATDDVCMATAGIPADTVLFTVDGQDVTAEKYLYWAVRMLDSYYYYYGEDGDYSWISACWDTGVSDAALNNLLYYMLPRIHASEFGLEDDDAGLEAEVEEQIADYKADYEDEAGFEDYLQENCISESGFQEILAERLNSQKLKAYLYGEGGAYAPRDDEILSWADELGYYNCRYVFVSTVYYYTDEALERAAERAQIILDNIALAEDQDAYFAEIAADSSWNDDTEDGVGRLTAGGDICEKFDEAVRALKIGEISGIVDDSDEYGYFIIQRLAIDPDDLRETCISDLFNQQIGEWIDGAEIVYTDAFETIDITSFYSNLIDYRASL